MKNNKLFFTSSCQSIDANFYIFTLSEVWFYAHNGVIDADLAIITTDEKDKIGL